MKCNAENNGSDNYDHTDIYNDKVKVTDRIPVSDLYPDCI